MMMITSKLLQSIGKADEIEHTQEYNEHNLLYKDALNHYNHMDKLGKKIIKACDQVTSAEQLLGTHFHKYSEELDKHELLDDNDDLTSLQLALSSVGNAFHVLASLRDGLVSILLNLDHQHHSDYYN
jgi:hypothetical protein